MERGCYSPLRQKPLFMMSSGSRVRCSTVPYVSRNHDGATPFPSSGVSYLQRGAPGLHSHVVPLIPTGYPSRSVPTAYNVMSPVASRPRVIPVHTLPVGTAPNVRHYPRPRSQVEAPSNSTLASSTEANTVYRSVPIRPSLIQNVSNASVPRSSSTASNPAKGTSATYTQPSNIPKEEKDPATIPALAILPHPQSSPDPSSVIMTDGLRLQQKWMEKDELKNLYFYFSCVSKMLMCISNSSSNTDVAWSLCEKLRTLLEKHITQELLRFKERINYMVHSQKTTDADVSFIAERLANRLHSVAELRDTELSAARNNVIKAKRRRQYKQELEVISAEIMARKPQHVYQKELDQEESKLHEIEDSLSRWQRVVQLRRAQVDGVHLHIRDILQSLKDPMTFFPLEDDSTNSDIALESAVAPVLL